MDRENYLRKLYGLLLWRYKREEVQEIMGDYEEYFDAGEKSGKTEETLCRELGTPEQVIRDLREEKVGDGRVLIRKAVCRGAAAILFWILSLWLVSRVYTVDGMAKLMFAVVPAVMLLAWFLFGGKKFSIGWKEGQIWENKQVKEKNRIKASRFFWVIQAAVLIVSLFFYLYERITLVRCVNGNWTPFGMELQYVGPYLTNLLNVGILFLLGLTAVGIYGYRKYSVQYFGICCHGMGSIYMLLGYRSCMRFIDGWPDAAAMHQWFLLLYGEVLLLCLVFSLILLLGNKKGKGGKDRWMHK